MKIMHLFSSKVFAGLERHLEELTFEQSSVTDGKATKSVDVQGSPALLALNWYVTCSITGPVISSNLIN